MLFFFFVIHCSVFFLHIKHMMKVLVSAPAEDVIMKISMKTDLKIIII